MVPLFMIDFYNVKTFNKTTAPVPYASTQIINALTDVVNTEHILPKYLIVVPDHDILYDVDLFSSDAGLFVSDITRWFVRQINTVVHHKRVDLLAKKPGTLSGYSTTIIMV